MHLYRQRQLEMGFVVCDVPGIPGMPIDAYIRWMLAFSVPFVVCSLFVLSRLLLRLDR